MRRADERERTVDLFERARTVPDGARLPGCRLRHDGLLDVRMGAAG
jgi:hypothetical protein